MQNAKIKIKNDRLKMKNTKSETLNSKQYQNPNDKNPKRCLEYLNLEFV